MDMNSPVINLEIKKMSQSYALARQTVSWPLKHYTIPLGLHKMKKIILPVSKRQFLQCHCV
jgi:hypothetical protein